MRSASLTGMVVPLFSSAKRTLPSATSAVRVTRSFLSGSIWIPCPSAGCVNLMALSSCSSSRRLADRRLVVKSSWAPGPSFSSKVRCRSLPMPVSITACCAMSSGVTRSLRSSTVWLFTSDSSSILFTSPVMRSVLCIICCEMSAFSSSVRLACGEVSIWVKPLRMFSGVRISWDICLMKSLFMRVDSSARALAICRRLLSR